MCMCVCMSSVFMCVCVQIKVLSSHFLLSIYLYFLKMSFSSFYLYFLMNIDFNGKENANKY